MRVIIVGAVAAGMSAAAKLKRMKPEYDVVVYEKTDVVSFGACGLPYFVGGFFDDANNMIARSAEKFRETGIDLKSLGRLSNDFLWGIIIEKSILHIYI